MPNTGKSPDGDIRRGIAAALHQAFNDPSGDAVAHMGADAADADFAALLAQLNDPPDPYRPAKG
jgi:hypothetical protein